MHTIKVPTPKVKVAVRSEVKLDNNSKTAEANSTKLHRKIEHNEKVWCTQELGSNA